MKVSGECHCMSCDTCDRLYVSRAKGGETGLELILTAAFSVIAQICILRVFERRSEKRWESYRTLRNTEESFWRNIISYDHEKGGEKE